MKRKFSAVFLLLTLLLALAVPAYAYDVQQAAADRLYTLGLFNGVGDGQDGTPDYALERTLSRQEAVTLLVRLLGAEEEAKNGSWYLPFADVDDWARPYVGYAYANGLTNGLSDTVFGGTQPVTAAQYLTFVLRAMGYISGVHFSWDTAWDYTDGLGMTAGEYHAGNNAYFLRGDAVLVSSNGLDAMIADGSGRTLLEMLEERGVINGRLLAPVDRPEPGYRPEVDGQESVRAILYQFVQDMMETGEANGDITWSHKPHRMKETVGWYSYYAEGFGSEESALVNALRDYLFQCMDGDYARSENTAGYRSARDKEQFKNSYDPLFITLQDGDIYGFVHADENGMITAYGTCRPGDPEGYQVHFCQVDSTQLVKYLRTAHASVRADALIRVDCEMVEQDGKFLCTFLNLPENAVWMRGGSSSFKKGHDNWEVNVDSMLASNWEILLGGVEPRPVERFVETTGEDSRHPGVASRLFVFLDADYNMIAYALGQVQVN